MTSFTKKTVVVHIGPHKTASTFVQTHMNKNAEHLKSLGVVYPKTFLEASGHHGLFRALRQKRFDKIKILAEEIAPYSVVILSSENFTHLRSGEVKLLKEVFVGYEMKVVFYLRSPHELWPSHWQEKIKHGEHLMWPEYMLSVLGFSDRVNLSNIRPLAVLDKWVKTVGMENIIIVPFEVAVTKKFGVIEPLMDLIGISASGLDVSFDRGLNSAYKPERIEVLRCLNLLEYQNSSRVNDQVRRLYIAREAEIEMSDVYQEFLEFFDQNKLVSVLEHSNKFVQHSTKLVKAKYKSAFLYEPSLERLKSNSTTYINPTVSYPAGMIPALFEQLEN